ncbi:hypothetical protein [Wolbachia endosymbiont (group A) of Lasioglossum morio]|uniref:hypothetical protein n=1 Tax=Wolbachia endosymbiont (group A) of Lasioglossum morio TaxID=2954025 RepID=UPI002227371C|nr:hypothetical protein [Wolbachia endosymbiont (group A) of Lasioglossum morio]
MSNYSVKESVEDDESLKRIVEDEYRMIDDIEVKIKPKSFESNKEKNASVGYVHTILDKLIADLNDTFVSDLDYQLRLNANYVQNKLSKDLYDLDKVVMGTNQNYEILEKNFNNLREEVEKLKTGTVSDDNIDEWEAPTHSDIL